MERTSRDESLRCARLFWIWLPARTAVWFAIAAVLQKNPQQDLVESAAWGHVLAWGYPKQPPLTSWLAEAFARLSPGDVWGVYLAGCLAAALCLWAIWRVGLSFLPPRAALFAVLCLDGLSYLTGDAADFNNNILLCALWALAVMSFERATRTGSTAWWLALGAWAGLGLLCKYPIVFLLAALGGYLLFHREGRRHLSRSGPYLALVVAAAMFLPHVVWLFRHDFLPFQYAAARAAAKSGGFVRVKHPLLFGVSQIVALIPVLLVLAPWITRHTKDREPQAGLARLHWAVIGPVVLLLAYSAATGAQLRPRWGGPFMMFAGVWLLAAVGERVPSRPRWSAAAWGLTASSVVAFCVGQLILDPYVSRGPVRAAYPGRQLAEEVARRWSARRAEPFPIVAGEAWRASNVCCFAPHRPIVYTSGDMGLFTFDAYHAFWTDDLDLARRGGVILWGAHQLGDGLPGWVRARFPEAEVQAPIVLPYQTGARIRPDRVGIAIIWPGDSRIVR
jgi:4-amino-4-deoxy-L-arabinose transferase-like glycosyltransferase